MSSTKTKRFPTLESDATAEAFVAEADLIAYDWTDMRRVEFEFARKDERVNMRLPAQLLAAVKARAAREGMPYQRFIRRALEGALGRS